MKVLILTSGNSENFVFEKNMAFVYDQMQTIKKLYPNVEFDIFLIKGKGIKGYLKQVGKLKNYIKETKPDLIHAHGGHIGLVAVLQRIIPVVVTFHGSEVNVKKMRYLSNIVFQLANYSIPVSLKLADKLIKLHKNYSVIPCGVDFSLFFPVEKSIAKKELGIDEHEQYILFASNFDNEVKNFPLAQEVLKNFDRYNIREIKNKTREEVNLLLNGADALIMTSFMEGSPQITKEALACNVKVLSVNVGDVEEQFAGVDGYVVSNPSVIELRNELEKLLNSPQPTQGRIRAEKYNNDKIADKIYDIYKKVLAK